MHCLYILITPHIFHPKFLTLSSATILLPPFHIMAHLQHHLHAPSDSRPNHVTPPPRVLGEDPMTCGEEPGVVAFSALTGAVDDIRSSGSGRWRRLTSFILSQLPCSLSLQLADWMVLTCWCRHVSPCVFYAQHVALCESSTSDTSFPQLNREQHKVVIYQGNRYGMIGVSL